MATTPMEESAVSRPLNFTFVPQAHDLVSICDFSPHEIELLMALCARMKAHPGEYSSALKGKQVVLFFEKPSLRTRLTFEAGMGQLGGASFFFDQTASRLGAREPLSDVAHNLERWVNGIVLRTFEHSTVTGMAENASIPVINALSDLEHPCQALADYFTLSEHLGDLRKVRLAYVGDGNNMAHSLMLTAVSLGSHISIGTPNGYGPNPLLLARAQAIASTTGGSVEVKHDPAEAVRGANAVYTDVWASMGQEDEAEERRGIFLPFQVNQELMSHAAPGALFMHCLPAHRGEEVEATVIDSPASVVFDQAENRLHIQKAIMLSLMGGKRRQTQRSANA